MDLQVTPLTAIQAALKKLPPFDIWRKSQKLTVVNKSPLDFGTAVIDILHDCRKYLGVRRIGGNLYLRG